MESTEIQVPTLAPEEKINMSLDEIIRHEKMKAGVSHNLQFKKTPYLRRRYRSQNWRLRQNGPNTPRYRSRKRYGRQRVGRVKAFLERKWRTKPMNSVFHRLGWTPAQSAARSKLWFARNFRRPQRLFTFRRGYFNGAQHDPNRASKLKFAFRRYQQNNGLEHLQETKPSLPLNEVNLERLKEALGGEISSIKEEQSDAGSVYTITRVDPPVFQQPTPPSYGWTPYSSNSNQSLLYNQMGFQNYSMANHMPWGYSSAFPHVNNHPMNNMTFFNQREVSNNPSFQVNNLNRMERNTMTPNSISDLDMPPLVISTGRVHSQAQPQNSSGIAIHSTSIPCSLRFSGLAQTPSAGQPQQSMELN